MRLVIFSSAPVPGLRHVLRRLAIDLPEVAVVGVVYRLPPVGPSPWLRVRQFCRLLPDRDFRRHTCHQFAARVGALAARLGDCLLRWAHACPPDPNGKPVTLDTVTAEAIAAGIDFLVTKDAESEQTLSFVRGLRPDLGVVLQAGPLPPRLAGLPARGWINLHAHSLPEYPEAGRPGLRELADGKEEAAVTVHRVLPEGGIGNVLGERRFAIEVFDTLESIDLKAGTLGLDLLIDVLRAEPGAAPTEGVRQSPAPVPPAPPPHRLFALERAVRASRPGAGRAVRGRPLSKLFLRTLTYPLLFLRNVWRRRRKSFPVVILIHHLVTDRPHRLGISTDCLARQVRYLKKHYRIVSLADAVAILREGACSVPTVALTFDDGYAANYLGLRAIAEAENIPVAIFVATRNVTEGSAFQHDLDRGQTDFPALTWDQVRHLDRQNVTIGSHTRSHYDCGSADRERLAEEIVGSREDLERELGHGVSFFAFPWGRPRNMSAAALDIVRQAYPFFVSAANGDNRGPIHPPCELKRRIHPDSLWELELQLQSVLDLRPGGPPDSR